MGRETRQTRRARQRREAQKQQHKGPNWSLITGAAVIVAALFIFGGLAVANALGGASGPSTNTTALAPVKAIDGVGCGYHTEAAAIYHVHSHVAIYDAGKPVTVPAYVGFNYNHDCLYWLHTHDATGIIHIEAPSTLKPTLGDFFDVWHQPLSPSRAATAVLKPGQHMKVWVNGKPYTGNPRNIPLGRHQTIQIDLGAPYPKPKKFNYGNL